MLAAIKDFWLWWIQAIKIEGLRSKKAGRRKRFIVGQKGFRFVSGSLDQKPAELQPFESATTFSAKQASIAAEVTLDTDMFIDRRLTDFSLPHSDAVKMASFDLTRSTPFQKADVYLNIPSPHLSRQHTGYQIIRKDLLDQKLQDLKRLGVKPQRIAFLSEDEKSLLSIDDLERSEGIKMGWRLPAFVALLSLFFLGTIVHQFQRYQVAETALAGQIEVLSAKADDARIRLRKRQQIIENLVLMRESQAEAPAITLLWEELTRALPDSAYLTDLRVSGGTISIAGFAKSAASLLPTLEASDIFEQVEFVGQVVNVPGQEGQRFNLAMRGSR